MRVRVPASSANLGPGFDSFAIALPLLAEFDVRPARTWSVDANGEGIPAGEDNLFVIAARAVGKAARANVPAQHVQQRSANALLGEPLDRRTLLRVASEVEGHPDNVAAALYGAFTLALPEEGGPVATRIAFPRTWRICMFIPSATLETASSRDILPTQVSRDDAVFNLAHAAALVAAVLRADGALLSLAMSDRLHQPARTSLVPALAEIIGAARGAGAFGAALSGAGPSVIAIAPTRLAPRVVSAMEEAAEVHDVGGRGRVLRVRAAGAQVTAGDSR